MVQIKKKKKRERDEVLPFATIWMELEGILLSELSQMEEDKCHIFFTHVEYKKQTTTTKINEQTKPNKNKHVDTENRVVVTRGGGS